MGFKKCFDHREKKKKKRKNCYWFPMGFTPVSHLEGDFEDVFK